MDNSKTKSCNKQTWICALGSWVLGNATTYTACRMALLPLRLMIGLIFMVHGAQKAFGWFGGSGFQNTVGMVESIGFPLPLIWAVLLLVAELGGGVALIFGLATRLAAILIAVVMVVAMTTVHAQDGFLGTHLQQMILVACITLLLAGGGAFSILSVRRRKPTP